jgi:hypothetical protein
LVENYINFKPIKIELILNNIRGLGKINKEKTFIDWYKENCVEKNLITFIGGRKLVHQYLLDDLWETEQVDELYNQSSFMLAKIVPTVYQRICTMGTASIWNLLLT